MNKTGTRCVVWTTIYFDPVCLKLHHPTSQALSPLPWYNRLILQVRNWNHGFLLVSKEKFNSVENLILFIFSLTLKIRRWPPLSPRGGGSPRGGSLWPPSAIWLTLWEVIAMWGDAQAVGAEVILKPQERYDLIFLSISPEPKIQFLKWWKIQRTIILHWHPVSSLCQRSFYHLQGSAGEHPTP